MTLAAFIGIALIHLAAAISPGPSFVVAVRTAAAEGMVPA
ncbi:MAG: LysE family translocator, partial [Silicimonas sp.]|nr:LysE family translocator [Silicimonas sp.]